MSLNFQMQRRLELTLACGALFISGCVGAGAEAGGESDTSADSTTSVTETDSDTDTDPGTGTDCAGVEDECPFDGGLTHLCKQRFALGINYAWHHFGGDFGGIGPWGQLGVASDSATYSAELASMRAAGVSVLRWWMWPDFRGDGVQFDEHGDPTGLSTEAVADIQEALALAEQHDLYLVLTIFSFDNFRPDRDEAGIAIPGISPMIRDPDRQTRVLENIVRPTAQAVAASEHSERLLGWDIINEPEWAIAPTGLDPQDFTPNEDLDVVTLDEMKQFISAAAGVLHEETPDAKVSAGWAAAKWSWALADTAGLDFHQPHIYGWVNQYWPYTMTPAELGFSGKPTVMGEFYLESMPFTGDGDDSTLEQILSSWFESGFAGAWSWHFNENAGNLPLQQAFADARGCQVRY